MAIVNASSAKPVLAIGVLSFKSPSALTRRNALRRLLAQHGGALLCLQTPSNRRRSPLQRACVRNRIVLRFVLGRAEQADSAYNDTLVFSLARDNRVLGTFLLCFVLMILPMCYLLVRERGHPSPPPLHSLATQLVCETERGTSLNLLLPLLLLLLLLLLMPLLMLMLMISSSSLC